jgi:hypothetical protein
MTCEMRRRDTMHDAEWKHVGVSNEDAAGWPLVYEAVRSRLVELEVENTRLQRLVAELLMKNQQLRRVGEA